MNLVAIKAAYTAGTMLRRELHTLGYLTMLYGLQSLFSVQYNYRIAFC
jgi:hypothetical protein